MADVEDLFDAISRGDLAKLQSMLPKRLVPHAELMSRALNESLDPLGRMDRRYGRRSKKVKPLEMVEFLLSHRALDIDPAEGDELGQFRHLQSMIEAYSGVSRLVGADAPLHTALREATLDRFIARIERDPSSVRLRGLRGQTLLHEAAMAGEAEFAAVLIRSGSDPDAKELEGHTPLYRTSTAEVARVLLEAGATVDVPSGPTRGTPLHQAARQGRGRVATVLLDHGADLEARDNKGQTPLRRAVNCRKLQLVELFVRRGANPHAEDNRGVTPLDVARTAEMKRALADT
jgi:ankyrin repeat protein